MISTSYRYNIIRLPIIASLQAKINPFFQKSSGSADFNCSDPIVISVKGKFLHKENAVVKKHNFKKVTEVVTKR